MGDAGMSGGFLGARRRLVDVIERHRMPERVGGCDHSPSNIGRNFLPPLLVVRDVPLRHANGFAKCGLR